MINIKLLINIIIKNKIKLKLIKFILIIIIKYKLIYNHIIIINLFNINNNIINQYNKLILIINCWLIKLSNKINNNKNKRLNNGIKINNNKIKYRSC